MSHIKVNARTYLTDLDDFAYKRRTLLKIKDSALVEADLGITKAYIGKLAKVDLIDTSTKKNALEQVYDIPLDVRIEGIKVLTSLNIPIDTQTIMFNNFMKNYTLEQRRSYSSAYDAVDKTDSAALTAFATQMVQLLMAA